MPVVPCGSVPEWWACCWRRANDGGQPAEHHVAADRFARKIVRFLTHFLQCACGAELNRSAAVAAWLAILFYVNQRRFLNARCAHFRCATARYAAVVRRPVVRNARGASVVRTRVVRMARRAARDRVRWVVPTSARRAGVIACWCGSTKRASCRVVPCRGGARRLAARA